MTGKRALASLCAFALVFFALRAALRPSLPPTQAAVDNVQLSAPSPALQTAAKALFSNPPDRPSAQNGRASSTPPFTGETRMPRPDSAHPAQRWSAETSGQASSVGNESSAGPAVENSASSFHRGQIGQTAPSWQLPAAGGGRAPIAGGAPQFPRSGRAASPAPAGSAGGAMAGSTAGAGRAAPAPGKKVVAGAVASSGGRADAGAGPGFDGGLQLPNARPSSHAGARPADADDTGPVRTMGALSGAPGGGSAPSAAADSGGGGAAASGDGGGGSSGGPGEGGLAAAQSKAKAAADPKPDDGDAAPAAANEPAAPAKRRGHRGHSAAAGPESSDPTAPDAAAPGAPASGTTAADPATPPTSPDGKAADPTDPADPADASGSPRHPVAQVKPVVGFPRLPDAQPTGDPFAPTPDGPASVQTFVFQTASAKPGFAFKAEMANDRNGRSNASTPPTALRYPDGTSLNPDQIPFMTIPKSFADAHPEVKLGDYGAISYGGKTLYTIVGDYGPPGGSRVTWTGLGIDLSAKDGLTGPQVHFTTLAGSGDGKIPNSAADVETAAQAAFDAAKVPTR
jgi:hypothetical protein